MKALSKITIRMLEIETLNIRYNEQTNFGNIPNGEEEKIKNLLSEWDILRNKRQLLKNGDLVIADHLTIEEIIKDVN